MPSEKGRSDAGLYGDVVQGLDDTGRAYCICLKSAGVWIIRLFSSPAIPARGGKGAASDADAKGLVLRAAFRVRFIAHWPQQIKPARSEALAMGTDLLPTMLDELNLPLPPDRMIDGKSLCRDFCAAGRKSA